MKNGDEVPAVIVQAPWMECEGFSAAEHYRSFSSRWLARSARSVHDVMEGHVVTRQRPERVAGCDPTWCGDDGPPTDRSPIAHFMVVRGTLAVVDAPLYVPVISQSVWFPPHSDALLPRDAAELHSVQQREPSGAAFAVGLV